MTSWNRGLLAVALLTIPALPLRAQDEPEPFARARLDPPSAVTVGQPVTVTVEVLVPTWFTAAPWFPDLAVDDAIAVFEDRGINFTEKIANVTWAAQSRSYQVYPQRAGTFEIGEMPVRLQYMSDAGGRRTRVIVSPSPIRFEAVIPEEARGLSYFISTPQLEAEQSFDREPGTLRVGEAFTRSIEITVTDALSMVIPAIVFEPVPGLAVYPDPPRVEDEGGERGERFIGRRFEQATYVAEREGKYVLPGIELSWWDVNAGRLRTEAIPAVEILVEPNPDFVAEIPLPPEATGDQQAEADPGTRVLPLDLLRRWGAPLGLALLALLLALRLIRRYGPRLRDRWVQARSARRESESAYFSRFRRAVRSGDAREIWRQWTSWLDRTHAGPGAATIRGFVDEAGDPALEREASALEGDLFDARPRDGAGWSKRALYRAVSGARRRSRTRSRAEPACLPTLNPRRGRGLRAET